jgi:hypothetical protein
MPNNEKLFKRNECFFFKFVTEICKFFVDLSSYYRKMSQKEGVSSLLDCGTQVHSTWSLTTPSSRANAFKFQNSSCEIGIISPLYGYLDTNVPLPKGPNIGYILSGCLGNCKKRHSLLFCGLYCSRIHVFLLSHFYHFLYFLQDEKTSVAL